MLPAPNWPASPASAALPSPSFSKECTAAGGSERQPSGEMPARLLLVAAETLLIKSRCLPGTRGTPDYHGSNQIYPKECSAEMTAVKRWALFLNMLENQYSDSSPGALCREDLCKALAGTAMRCHRFPAGMPTAQRGSIWDGAGDAGDRKRPHSLWLRATSSRPSAERKPLPTDGFAGPSDM